MSSSAFDRLLEEFQRRWMRGQTIRAEDYIRELVNHHWTDEERLDVIYAEVLLREEAGESLNLEEYLQRFPDLSEAIQVQWDVHFTLASLLDTESPDRPATQPESADRTSSRPPAPEGFELQRQIGRGGSGVVFLAKDLRLNRLVAIKYLDSASADMQAKLEREAQVLASIAHPGIIQVYAVGTVNGKCWMAVEYAGGGSVRESLRGRVLDGRTAAELLLKVSQAVGAAHAHGIVHCDLNPGNLLIKASSAPNGEIQELQHADVRVTDFGLARVMDVAVTSTTSIEGTFLYMSPEQGRADRKSICPASDVYSLGATLYEFLTGRPPFTGSHPAEILEQLFHNPPTRLRDLRAGIPVDLETICLKCLEKSPAARYATGSELADDLQRFLDGHPVVARPIGPIERFRRWSRRNRRLALAIMTSFVLLVLGICSTSAVAIVASHYRTQAEKQAQIATQEARNSKRLEEESSKARVAAEDAQRKADQTAAENQQFSDNLVQMIYSADPRITKRQWTVAEMIIKTSEDPEFWKNLSDKHAFRLKLAFARSLMGASRQPKAVPLYRDCLAYAKEHLDPFDPLVLNIKLDLATLETDQQNSISLLKEIIAEERFPAADREYTQVKLAEMLFLAGRAEEAEQELAALISKVTAGQSPSNQSPRDPSDVSMLVFRARMLQARIMYSTRRAESALPLCQELCETIPEGMQPFAALEPSLQLAECYRALGRAEDAVQVYRDVVPKLHVIGGRAHLVTVDTVMELLMQMLATDDAKDIAEITRPYLESPITPSQQPPFVLAMIAMRLALESPSDESQSILFEGQYSLEAIVRQLYSSEAPSVVNNLKCIAATVEHLKRKQRIKDAQRLCELSLEYLNSPNRSPDITSKWKPEFEKLMDP